MFNVNQVCNFQNKLWLFMQKKFNAKSHSNENYCKCVIYFQKIFRHCFIWGLRIMFIIIF